MRKFLRFEDSCNNGALLIQAKFCMRQYGVFIVLASIGQKPQLWANVDIWGDSCTDPLLVMRAKFGVLEQTHGLCLRAKFHLDQFILLPNVTPIGAKVLLVGRKTSKSHLE